MWIADGWKDYEVIDTSCGEKLERWGNYVLVRPDPQVIWNTEKGQKNGENATGITTAATKAGEAGNSITCLMYGRLIIRI